jgi:pimeloyl-ACP methyl ester carboxylesterase
MCQTNLNIYCISGLGADKRAFEKLRFPEGCQVHHLEWIQHKRNERLEQYAKRLSQLIDVSKPFVLVGLSFGGMIAVAMNQYIHPEKTILISSIGCTSELPWYFRLVGKMQLHRCIPLFVLNHPTRAVHWLFGAKHSAEKTMLNRIITENDPRFFKWALGAILTWKQEQRPPRLFHIHGSQDKLLPLQYTYPDIVIDKGSHFSVWTKANAVSKAIAKALAA